MHQFLIQHQSEGRKIGMPNFSFFSGPFFRPMISSQWMMKSFKLSRHHHPLKNCSLSTLIVFYYVDSNLYIENKWRISLNNLKSRFLIFDVKNSNRFTLKKLSNDTFVFAFKHFWRFSKSIIFQSQLWKIFIVLYNTKIKILQTICPIFTE